MAQAVCVAIKRVAVVLNLADMHNQFGIFILNLFSTCTSSVHRHDPSRCQIFF